jgi:transcriptional regulator with XRE-family HTH domain
MAKKTAALLPATEALLFAFGDRLRLARLRRRLPARQVAERAGMAPMTLRSLERGGAGVTMGAYLAVMQVLGIEKDLDLLGNADPMGRALQDAELPARARAASSRVLRPPRKAVATAGPSQRQAPPHAAEPTPEWIARGGFTSADALAGLIAPATPRRKKAR